MSYTPWVHGTVGGQPGCLVTLLLCTYSERHQCHNGSQKCGLRVDHSANSGLPAGNSNNLLQSPLPIPLRVKTTARVTSASVRSSSNASPRSAAVLAGRLPRVPADAGGPADARRASPCAKRASHLHRKSDCLPMTASLPKRLPRHAHKFIAR